MNEFTIGLQPFAILFLFVCFSFIFIFLILKLHGGRKNTWQNIWNSPLDSVNSTKFIRQHNVVELDYLVKVYFIVVYRLHKFDYKF